LATRNKPDGAETCALEGGAEVLQRTPIALPRAALQPAWEAGADPDERGLRDLAEIERQVVVRLTCGQSPVVIADSLAMTVLAVRVLIKRAYAALGVRSKAELLARLDHYPVH
jgi:DNA-binding NarL/FixJ family response regulator